MMKTSRTLAILCAAVTILGAGCAGRHWTKPGADAAAISRDLDECRGAVLGRTVPQVAPSGSSEAITDRSRQTGLQSSAGSNERFLAEHEEARRCMLKRGYELR